MYIKMLLSFFLQKFLSKLLWEVHFEPTLVFIFKRK